MREKGDLLEEGEGWWALDSIGRGTEIGMWPGCLSRDGAMAAVFPCWSCHRDFRWHMDLVFNNVEVYHEQVISFSVL